MFVANNLDGDAIVNVEDGTMIDFCVSEKYEGMSFSTLSV